MRTNEPVSRHHPWLLNRKFSTANFMYVVIVAVRLLKFMFFFFQIDD